MVTQPLPWAPRAKPIRCSDQERFWANSALGANAIAIPTVLLIYGLGCLLLDKCIEDPPHLNLLVGKSVQAALFALSLFLAVRRMKHGRLEAAPVVETLLIGFFLAGQSFENVMMLRNEAPTAELQLWFALNLVGHVPLYLFALFAYWRHHALAAGCGEESASKCE